MDEAEDRRSALENRLQVEPVLRQQITRLLEKPTGVQKWMRNTARRLQLVAVRQDKGRRGFVTWHLRPPVAGETPGQITDA